MSDAGETVLVVPCFNEARRVQPEVWAAGLAERPWLRLLFVDDGSTDATADVLGKIEELVPEQTDRLELAHNRGKAEAVRRGILQALETKADFVGFWDADLATPLAEVDRFRELLVHDGRLDLVFGSRIRMPGALIERSALRHLFGRAAATLVAAILRVPIYDTQCGAKLFRNGPELGGLFAEPFLSRWAFDVEILARWLIATRHRSSRRYLEIPVAEWTDVPGSKIRPLDFLLAPRELWRIWRHYGPALRAAQ